MRFSFAVFALLGLTASAGAIAPSETRGPNDITDVTGSIHPDHVSIYFNTSCTGCFIGTNNGLLLNLVIPKSHGECLGPNPILNGVPLDQRWLRDQAHGRGHFPVQLSNGLGERQISVIWRSMCVRGEGQLLSVRVLELVDGGQAKDASGFTASFKQSGIPTILRLKNEDTHLGRKGHNLNSWLHPSEELQLRINGDDAVAPSALDAEFTNLEDIKHQMAMLQAVMRQQERTIVHMLKKDFKHCDGFQCMLQTAMEKAPDFAHLIAEHFSHEKVKLRKSENFDEIVFVNALGSPESPESPQEDAPHKEALAPPAPPPFDGEHPPSRDDRPHPSFKGDHPHPAWAGENPPPPEYHGEHPPPPPPPHDGDHPPPHHEDGPHGPPGRHNHGRPSFFGRIRHHRFRILKAALALLAGSFLMSLCFKAMRNCLPCLKDPRRRADRASRREERRNRCQYRRAAHRHRLTSWWAAHSPRRVATTDYDEKRALILAQEGILENAMQHEIRNLETAAELEEGRARFYNDPSTPHELHDQANSSGLRRQNSYPASDYSAPPPRYETELDEEMIPVNGFEYTPSNTDETPESSVVDFSPRMSYETLLTSTTKSE